MMRLLIFLLISFSFWSCKKEIKLRAITFNIRYNTESDGINKWDNRKEKVVDLINKHKPDILGIQEGLKNQVDYLVENLKEYTYCGVGRDDGKTKGEYAALFYKKSTFDEVSCTTFWLSETPGIPSSGWDAAFNRIVTQGELKLLGSELRIVVLNTHFDHRGEIVRQQSSKLISQKVEQFSEKPLILMGDFNAPPGSEPYSILAENPNLTDAYEKRGTQNGGTFASGFSIDNRGKERIDHIFINSSIEVLSHKIIEENDGTFYPSDHLPVMIDFIIPE